jgi:hypothetical protein
MTPDPATRAELEKALTDSTLIPRLVARGDAAFNTKITEIHDRECDRMRSEIIDLVLPLLAARDAALATALADGPPGQWICRTCGFRLSTMLLRASDGAVGIDVRPVEDICPNDGSSMRPVTWKEDALNSDRVGIEQMKRADAAEARLRELCDEIAADLSPGNENVKQGEWVAALRDIRQVKLSALGNCATLEARLKAMSEWLQFHAHEAQRRSDAACDTYNPDLSRRVNGGIAITCLNALALLDAAPVAAMCEAATVRPNGATTGPYPRCVLAFGHPGAHFFQMSDAAPVGEKETP